MLYKFVLGKSKKKNKIWESYHKFHLKIKILVRPGEGRSIKWT
jgi:hypothetical protein